MCSEEDVAVVVVVLAEVLQVEIVVLAATAAIYIINDIMLFNLRMFRPAVLVYVYMDYDADLVRSQSQYKK